MKAISIITGTRVVLDVPNLYWRIIDGNLLLHFFHYPGESAEWKRLPLIAGDYFEEKNGRICLYVRAEIFNPSYKGWRKIEILKNEVKDIRFFVQSIKSLISSTCKN